MFCFSVYAQNFLSTNYQPNIIQLTGFQDNKNNTQLLYRINYNRIGKNYFSETANNIYKINTADNSDSLFLKDYSLESEIYWDIQRVHGFDMPGNDPDKVIASVDRGGDILEYYFVDKKDSSLFMGVGSAGFLSFFKNSNDFGFVLNRHYLMRFYSDSIDHKIDTLGEFNAISHSPFDDSTFFGLDNGFLTKTTNAGKTKTWDSSGSIQNGYPKKLVKTIFYDKDGIHIYRVVPSLGNTTYFAVSNNKGEPGSWQTKLYGLFFISNDDSTAGLIYLAAGRYIYVSTDFGDSFSLYKTLNNSIKGIYKQPKSDILYAADAYNIWKITSGDITLIKHLPFEKDVLRFDPISVGNKWVYNGTSSFNGNFEYNYVKNKTVLKDTLINGKSYRKIEYVKRYSNYPTDYSYSYQYERIDTSNGLVYFFDENSGNESLADDLNIIEGDSLNASRYFPVNPYTFCTLTSLFTEFNLDKMARSYMTSGLGFSYYSYRMAMDVGMVYLNQSIEDRNNTEKLKGFVIDGKLTGDTVLVVGVNDLVNNIPAAFKLKQNYPNPFNPSTKISYSLSSSSRVTLDVFDVLGNKIASLVNEEKPAGVHEVNWNASQNSSGVYFYRIKAGSFVETKKMLLLK